MNWLVDAQLPRRLAALFRAAGHDAIHTLDLPAQNRTSDADILNVAIRERRVVVTKDADFVASFHLQGRPERLLLISTGNITNRELEALIGPVLAEITAAFQTDTLVELTRTALIIHA